MAGSRDDLTASIEVNSGGVAEGHTTDVGMSPDVMLILLTWVTFFLLLAVLHKFAWKPILSALDAREESIRKSLENAGFIAEKMARIEETCDQILSDAQGRAKQIVDQSRKTASQAAKIIEDKAREEADISLENTLREIRKETQKAQTRLREESARLAVDLASKLIEENLDDEKNQKLVTKFINEI